MQPTRLVALLAIIALTRLPRLGAQSPDAAQARDFDRADRRARSLIGTVRCAGSVSSARSQGLFGPIESLGSMGQCVMVDGRYVGVFAEVDTAFVRPTRFAAVDLATRTRRTAPLDTAAVLALGRAELAAQQRGAGAFAKANRQYAPLAFRVDGDSIEVWLFPVAILTGDPPSVGGERGYVFSPDGRTVAREVNAFDDFRALALPDTGTVRIASRELAVPSLSELVLTNLLNDAGRQVSIETQRETATLVGRGGQAMWLRAPRGK
jgi:hypothetical protein